MKNDPRICERGVFSAKFHNSYIPENLNSFFGNCFFLLEENGEHDRDTKFGPVVRALALRSGDPGFMTRSDHALNLFLLVPGSTS